MNTYHYIIKGRVQGVAFRHYTVKAAQEFNINGSVKNLFNGDVEVYAQGEPANLERFEKFLHSGPVFARVKEVQKSNSVSNTAYESFDVVF